MSLSYQFNVEHAQKYGVNEAIFLHNLTFWILKNRSNQKNQFEERTWTYNSYNAYVELFPFWTRRQIRYIVQTLVEKKVIIVRSQEGSKQNDGLFYAFFNEKDFLPEVKLSTKEEEGVGQNCHPPGQNCHTTPLYTYNKPYKNGVSRKKKEKDQKQTTLEPVMGVNYHCDKTEHCQFNHQEKKFGDIGYFCMNPAQSTVHVQNERGQKFNLEVCPRHENMALSKKIFKFDAHTVIVIPKEG